VGLKTLIIARNNLSTAESIEHLTSCQSLECLDITNNSLDGENIMQVIYNIPHLITLSINGNEVTKQPSFRKKTIATMSKLGYLDRPVEELERIVSLDIHYIAYL
jgi:Leucine-rich repeat (LRR) protein